MEEERNELFSAIKGFDNSRLKHQTPRVTQLGSMVAGIDSTGWRSFGSYAVFGTGNDASNDPKGNEAERLQSVAFSSRFVAAMRAVETEGWKSSSQPLFNDSYAHILAGEDAVSYLKDILSKGGALEGLTSTPVEGKSVEAEEGASQPYWSADRPYLLIRTKFFDDYAWDRASSGKIKQLCILGSGMDSRALRMPWPSGTQVFEFDKKDVLGWKIEKLHAQLSSSQEKKYERLDASTFRFAEVTVHLLAIDLREDWKTALIAAGFNPALPTAWIIEGLLYYLEDSQADRLMGIVNELSAEGSSLCIDLINGKEKEACSFRSNVDHPEGWVASLGGEGHRWDTQVAIQPGDEGANYGRFSRPFPPRLGQPGAPAEEVRRAFLVIANRK